VLYWTDRTDVNVDFRHPYLGTALSSAIDKQNPRIVEALLERNADPAIVNHWGTTPFSLAKGKFDELSEDLQRIFQRDCQPDNADIVLFSKSVRVLQILRKLSVGKQVLRCKKVR
jgi:ankyrin repeat protein